MPRVEVKFVGIMPVPHEQSLATIENWAFRFHIFCTKNQKLRHHHQKFNGNQEIVIARVAVHHWSYNALLTITHY